MASTDPTANDSDSDVFGSLPDSRPQRRSAKRDRPADTAAKARGATAGRTTTSKARSRAGAGADKGADMGAGRAPKPAPVPPVPPAGYATPSARDDGPLRGLELVTTAFEAIGELLAIGLTAGTQVLRAALRSLPRP
jgi:hypothetical protein